MKAITDFLSRSGDFFSPEDPVRDAIESMQKSRSSAVIVLAEGKPVGIFTERDVLMRLDFSNPSSIAGLKLKDVMSSDLITINFGESFGKALQLMRDRGIRNLPVMEGGIVPGILTLRDLLNNYASHLEHLLSDTVTALSSAIGKRDPYTADHQRKVAKISMRIAEGLGLDSGRKEGLQMAAMVHDVGKTSVPIELLCKPGSLSRPEFELIKQHPETGYEILKGIDFEGPVADIVLQHHERMDGSGYPHALHGDDILLEARIIAVADVFEAVMAHRPYRQALGLDVARKEILAKRGTAFDSSIVDAFLSKLDETGSSILEDIK